METMVPFNKPPRLGTEEAYVIEAMRQSTIAGDGPFMKKCEEWFESRLDTRRALMTPSCTHALEMAAILLDIGPGDEVIMPSYTFVSTANAFALRGARIVFVDLRPDTMNIDESLIEEAITPRTKAIVPVHYAGVGCEMERIMEIAERYGLFVVEDAAQGMMASYRDRALGTIGHLGCYSFHETKNYTSGGEGGLLLVNDERFVERAEIIREKGTNRRQFFRGLVDKYSWVDIGSSYLPSELQCAYLYAQLLDAEKILSDRLKSWNDYLDSLSPLEDEGKLRLPIVPDEVRHNGHMCYIKVSGLEERTRLLRHMKERGVMGVFHYVPLHSAPAGERYGRFCGEDRYTTTESEKLLRLPLYYGLERKDLKKVVESVYEYFE